MTTECHALTIRRSGKVEMAYSDTQPWHGLGTQISKTASIDEIVAAAGMEWTAEETPVLFEVPDLGTYTVTDRKVLYRSDDGHPLGIVSSGYHRVQPRETCEFFRDLIENLGLTFATAGTLFGGRKLWCSGFIGEESVVDDRDLVRSYVLLSTSLDASMATTARFTSVRVVCRNTLKMATAGQAGVRVIHSTTFDAAKARKTLGLGPKIFETFMVDVRKLAATPVSRDRAVTLNATLGLNEDGTVSKRVMALFEGEAAGSEFSGAGGTAWGWLNAVTQFVDHDRKAMSDSHRMNSATFGSGDTLKNRALEIVKEFA